MEHNITERKVENRTAFIKAIYEKACAETIDVFAKQDHEKSTEHAGQRARQLARELAVVQDNLTNRVDAIALQKLSAN